MFGHPWIWIALSAWALLAAFGLLATRRNPLTGDDTVGVLYWIARAYCRVLHRYRVEGRENAPESGRGLIIIANHTAGIDPLLVQCAVPFMVRWMMAAEMMLPAFAPLWDMVGVIPVAGGGRETASARQAIRTIRAGECLGIFPEGRIERPPNRLLPFVPGVGLVIARTSAKVLPIIIDGTPFAPTAWGSLVKPSRSRVRVMPVIDYGSLNLKPEQIAKDLERRYQEWTGWAVGPAEPSARA